MVVQVDLFVDWKSATLGALRPLRVPKSDPRNPDSLAAVLRALRFNIERLLGDREVVVDTFIYGGFTAPDGADTLEQLLLNEALSRAMWTGRGRSGGVRYRDIVPVTFARHDVPAHRIHALFRPRLRVANARLRVRGDACSCRWLALTERWLSDSPAGSYLSCPECQATRIDVEREGQKMVDTLLTAHVVHAAALRRGSEQYEIWILSDDSDLLPAACTASALGATVRWLQTRPIRRYGYREVLVANDVGIDEVTYADP